MIIPHGEQRYDTKNLIKISEVESSTPTRLFDGRTRITIYQVNEELYFKVISRIYKDGQIVNLHQRLCQDEVNQYENTRNMRIYG